MDPMPSFLQHKPLDEKNGAVRDANPQHNAFGVALDGYETAAAYARRDQPAQPRRNRW